MARLMPLALILAASAEPAVAVDLELRLVERAAGEQALLDPAGDAELLVKLENTGIDVLGRNLGAEQIDEPSREVTADHVAAAASLGPARGQHKADAVPV